jgi:predicted methyltransferase
MNRLLLTPIVLALGCASSQTTPATLAASSNPPAVSATPAPGGDARASIAQALGGAVRTDKERARDADRHPLETLAFFGLRDNANVVELWPGGGYYTSILAPVLAARGHLAVTHFAPSDDKKDYDGSEAKVILERLAKTPDVFGKVERRLLAKDSVALGPDGSADFVLTFRSVHNWIEEGKADQVFAAIARVLKPGGVLGVEEHRGHPGMTVKQIRDTGYVPEDIVVALAQKAGLRYGARSPVNDNPKDTTDHPDGVWSLPPTLAGGEKDRETFLAIGESDRMTLRFVKP